MDSRRIDINWASLWKIVAVGLLTVTLFYTRDVLVLVFIALVISSALHRPVAYLEQKKIPRVLSVLMIFLIVVAIVGLLIYTVLPIVLIQLKYAISNISNIQLPFLESLGGSELVTTIDASISEWVGTFFYGGSNILPILGSLVGNALFVLVTIVLSFYLSIRKGSVERFIRSIMPLNKEAYVLSLYERTQHKLGKWLTSQLFISFLVGAMTFVGLLIIGADYALIIALLAMVLEIVPYVGPIATGLISFILILPQSASLAVLSVLVFFVIQQIENHIFQPLIVGKAVGIDPVLVVVAILAGSQLDGLLGAVIAVPVAIILQEVMDDWSQKKINSRLHESKNPRDELSETENS